MSKQAAAWGMEIGAQAIKAIRLERDGDTVRVSDFAHIPHKKVLTTPDVDQDELVRLSLGQFISQKTLEGEHLVMSVPGHAAFARFAKLPPVEPKKVPDIVKFEAVQQIPFPIEKVEWDYQTFMADDSPEVEVGIFAITRERVQQRLNLYAELGITPEALTLSPVAVYNAMSFDYSLAQYQGPLIFLDIGTSATDVIVVEEGRCWIRTFPLGGTHFTEAIASAFKLSYSKAEKLKREAATSKYAKQIMQAMRPVFSDLLQDLQRSIGYYQTAHSNQELTTMVGLGSTFKIPGLRKFLGQQLQLDVVRLDEYKKISVAGREAAAFAENAVNMGTAYGLALQGVGFAKIDANLVPVKALRDQIWHAKTKWFAAAAAIVIVGSGMMLLRPITDNGAMEPGGVPSEVTQVLSQGNRYKTEFQEIQATDDVGAKVKNMQRILEHRTIWPWLVHDVASALASTDPQDELLQQDVQKILAIDPSERRFVQLRRLDGQYVPAGDGKAPGEIEVTMRLEFSHDDPIEFLSSTVHRWLRENAEPQGDRADVPYRIVPESVRLNTVQLARFKVEEGGVETEERSGPSGRGGTRRPGGTTRDPVRGGAGGTGSVGGSNEPVMPDNAGPGSGSGFVRRKKKDWSKGPRRAPGSDVGFGGGGGGAPSAPTAPRAPIPINDDPIGGNEPVLGLADLDRMAPIKGRPSLYPVGSTIYRIPITFKVQIIDPNKKDIPADTTAMVDGEGTGS